MILISNIVRTVIESLLPTQAELDVIIAEGMARDDAAYAEHLSRLKD